MKIGIKEEKIFYSNHVKIGIKENKIFYLMQRLG
jgi:hypothetical protein